MTKPIQTLWSAFAAMFFTAALAYCQPAPPPPVFATFTYNGTRLEIPPNSKEAGPADQDPDGNWSEIAKGFQLSLRFETNVFRLGEPVRASVILRNVGGTQLKRTFVSGKGFESKLCRFIVTFDGREPMPRLIETYLQSLRQLPLDPKSQWKQVLSLNELYKMDKVGTYLITGLTAVEDKLSSPEIQTGNILIQIVAGDSNAVPKVDVPASSTNHSSTTASHLATPGSPRNGLPATHNVFKPSDKASTPGTSPKSNAGQGARSDSGSTENSLSTRNIIGFAGVGLSLAILAAVLLRAKARQNHSK